MNILSFSLTRIASRLHSKASRQDFFTNIVAKVKSGEIEQEEMTAHASTLMYVNSKYITVPNYRAIVIRH